MREFSAVTMRALVNVSCYFNKTFPTLSMSRLCVTQINLPRPLPMELHVSGTSSPVIKTAPHPVYGNTPPPVNKTPPTVNWTAPPPVNKTAPPLVIGTAPPTVSKHPCHLSMNCPASCQWNFFCRETPPSAYLHVWRLRCSIASHKSTWGDKERVWLFEIYSSCRQNTPPGNTSSVTKRPNHKQNIRSIASSSHQCSPLHRRPCTCQRWLRLLV